MATVYITLSIQSLVGTTRNNPLIDAVVQLITESEAFITTEGNLVIICEENYFSSVALSLDFGIEQFRSNGAQVEFKDLVNHSRASQATMVDSDGFIKWGPHNLARYSQEFEGAEWNTAASSVNDNQGVAPDGTATAALFGPNVGTVNAYIAQPSVGLEGLPCTMALWVKSNGATWVRLTNKSSANNKAYFNLSTGTVGTVVGGSASITDVGDGWYFIKFDVTSWAVSAFTDYIFGITDANNTVTHTSDGTNKAYIWGAHLYRSDLGGMVNNPDQIQTISKAKLLNGITQAYIGNNIDYEILSTLINSRYLGDIDGSGYIDLNDIDVYASYSNGTLTNQNYIDYIESVLHPYIIANNIQRYLSGSYVPTTTSAVYLPRRGHHVYNGYEWVNEGLLHESEARTNLNTYLEADTTNWVASGGGVITQLYENVLGAFAGVKVASNGTATNALKSPNLGSVTSGSTYCITLIWKPNTSNNCYVRADRTGVNSSYGYVTVDGSFTSVGTSVGTLSLFSHSEIASGIYSTSVLWVPNFTGATSFATGPYSTTVGEYITTYAGQLELGSTPSSLIPTSGSSVTRAAETLTIPSANLPWPTPQYIGGELVTNGTFNGGTTGWTGVVASLANVSDQLQITNSSAGGRATQTISTIAGNVYFITVDLVSATANAFAGLYVAGTTTLVASIMSGTTTGGTYTLVFAETVSRNLDITFRSNDASAVHVWDSVSVRAINPLSLSIQMDGRMTYADSNASQQHYFFSWYADASNQIGSWLDTGGTSTGHIDFRQTNAGVTDIVSTANSYLSPDILVPYNISSRHGSTFVNGAVDGTALTANTTPTALPDLSATDLDLASDYMGTIRSFRIWDKDIGEEGIVEVTKPSTDPSLSLTFDNTEESYIDLGWRQ